MLGTPSTKKCPKMKPKNIFPISEIVTHFLGSLDAQRRTRHANATLRDVVQPYAGYGNSCAKATA
jgi:hypothetical protein